MVNFDEVINRVDSDSFKWDAANQPLGSNDYKWALLTWILRLLLSY